LAAFPSGATRPIHRTNAAFSQVKCFPPKTNAPEEQAKQRTTAKKGLVVVVVEKEVKCLENMRKADSRKAKLLS